MKGRRGAQTTTHSLFGPVRYSNQYGSFKLATERERENPALRKVQRVKRSKRSVTLPNRPFDHRGDA